MRILIASHGYPPTHEAGAERRAERQALWFAARGHAVAVVAVESVETSLAIERERNEEVDVTRVHLGSAPGDRFLWSYDHPDLRAVLDEAVATHRPDILHVMSGYLVGRPALAAARAAGVPGVLTLTEYYFLCWRLNLIRPSARLCSGPDSADKCAACWLEQKRRFRLPARIVPAAVDAWWSLARHAPSFAAVAQDVSARTAALREAFTWADAVISPSHVLKGIFESWGLSSPRFPVIRQGLFPLGRPRRPEDRPGPTLRVGYFGQIKPHKGVDLVVGAVVDLLREGCPVTLDIRGDEHAEPRYVDRLKRRTQPFSQVRWHGPYTKEGCWDALAAVDLIVVPSRWLENSPTIILEAFAMRVPVLATRLGGMAELVDDGVSGLLFGVDDQADLHRQIRRLIEEPDLLERLAAGTPAVKTTDEEMHELAALYDQLLEERPRSAAFGARQED